ncbi:MAG TPA: malonic semialdehyde reductase [Rhodospirillaceae bacterium]|nr:MAG: malonic semialdehyde reductase [Alphaproteobacteria bacterium GWF2_58_20]HAU29277.1 malonic semialdehyde reductase [Rhodospirillaceae bacterium]
MTMLPDTCLDQIFRNARTHSAWLPGDIGDDLLQSVYNLACLGPTSANSCPMRIVFVRSLEAKEKLKACLAPGNIEKTMAAPVTAIIAQDMHFPELLPELFPHVDAKSWFEGNETLIAETAFRNSSLQGAYFMLAARSLGLDCGPMSGFDAGKLNTAFFPDGRFKANFLCNLGHGDSSRLFPRDPRLPFDRACNVL